MVQQTKIGGIKLKTKFNGWHSSNYFDTEEEAIQALIEDEKIWNDYVILKEVSLSNY